MKEIKDLKIEPNRVNYGICATFKVGDNEYYADICNVGTYYNECMIFAAVDGQVANWGDLYCNRDVDVCEEDLIKCINEFVDSL